MSKKIFTIDKKINNIYQYINHSKLIYEKSAYAWELVLEARKKIISRYSYKNKKFIMDVIDNLNNKGFYEYKNFLNHEEVLNICNYLNNNRTYSLKQLRKFSKKIDKLLSLLNVLSCKLPEKIVYEFQNIPPENDNVQNLWHMDTFHLTCKFWITLNDWDDNNGPFEYWKFSNKPTTNKLNFYSYVMKYHFNIFNMFGITGPMTKTRLLKDYANLSIHGSPRFNSNEKFIEKAKEFGFNKNNIKKFLSKKGTLIIADTSGFHRRGIILQNRKAVHGSIRFDPFKLQ